MNNNYRLKNYNKDLSAQTMSMNRQAGFTLIEIMVATSIFMVVMLIAIGSLMIASDSAKKSQALQSAMDNVNFAMDSMTRSLRMGTNYSCITTPEYFYLPLTANNDCPLGGVGGSGIAFSPANTQALHYMDRNTAYVQKERPDHTYALQRCDPPTFTCTDLVANNVNVQSLRFFVNGSNPPSNPSDLVQPSIYIIMKGTITIKSQPISFAIQTMVSQRTSE